MYRHVADGLMSRIEAGRRLKHLLLAHSWPQGTARDLIIESVPEDVGLKRAVIRSIEPALPSHCIWASNTSAIVIAEIAAAARRPERVIGMHFFHPADRMRLLEIAVPSAASDAVASARDFGVLLNKCVLEVVDAPGFYTTRVLSAYVGEGLSLLEEGMPAEAVDREAERFGFASGPLALLDRVGIDVAAAVAAYLGTKSRRAATVRSPLAELAAAGILGVKSGAGFYLYDDPMLRTAGPSAPRTSLAGRGEVNAAVRRVLGFHATGSLPARVIRTRLVMSVVDEAARALHDGVVRDRTYADVAAVLGFGFPPRTGGPFHYAAAHGIRT
jgi:3-hydroxyacyl-CoA dehydrogenase